MRLFDDETEKWKIICWLVRDIANGHITKGYSSFEEMCNEIKIITKKEWPDKYISILSELRVCTTNTKNRIDYQQLFVECLKFPYTRPAIKNPEGKDLFEIYGKMPAIVNETNFEEGTITKIEKNKNLLSIICFIPKSYRQVSENNYITLGDYIEMEYDSYENLGFNDKLIDRELQTVYEVPMIDYYKKLYKIKSGNDHRCIFFDVYDETTVGYILFDKLRIKLLKENSEIDEKFG